MSVREHEKSTSTNLTSKKQAKKYIVNIYQIVTTWRDDLSWIAGPNM